MLFKRYSIIFDLKGTLWHYVYVFNKHLLICFRQMFQCYISWKVFEVLRGYRNGTLTWNGLTAQTETKICLYFGIKQKNPQIFDISSYNWHLLHAWVRLLQKQPFADVLQNRCSEIFRKFHRKIVALKSQRPLLKRDLNTAAFLWKFLEHLF